MSLPRFALTALLTCAAGAVQSTEESEALDEAFLDYLAEFESDEDDWTIVEAAPPAKRPASETKPVKPAAARQTAAQPEKPATVDTGSKK